MQKGENVACPAKMKTSNEEKNKSLLSAGHIYLKIHQMPIYKHFTMLPIQFY